MKVIEFPEDHVDALQEVFNVGMGRAGSALGKLLDTFVDLSVPRIDFVASETYPPMIAEKLKDAGSVTGVRQAFHDQLRGEVLVLNAMKDPARLAAVLDLDSLEGGEFEEACLEMANIIVGACMSGLSDSLSCQFTFSPPTMLSTGGPVSRVFEVMEIPWEQAMQVEVEMSLSDFRLVYHVLIMMPDDCFTVLRKALDGLLEEFA